jgi:hypothetical protein
MAWRPVRPVPKILKIPARKYGYKGITNTDGSLGLP